MILAIGFKAILGALAVELLRVLCKKLQRFKKSTKSPNGYDFCASVCSQHDFDFVSEVVQGEYSGTEGGHGHGA